MALSQCLEDSPVRWPLTRQGNNLNVQELYNERHRLALEELISGGVDSFVEFLRKERIPNFLSDDEIRCIRGSAVVPRCVSLHGEDLFCEQTVIAIVTDSLTDLDIFKDLQEACTQRKVPVYILLDQSSVQAFLKMCSSINVRLDELQQMRVRTITGGTYFMRSGAKITGKVHERFMLIDGNRVATGSYRFNWTDGKLNSSNLIELSGQITENFDEEFRILYAQSVPVITRGPASARSSGIYDHLLIKRSTNSPHQPVGERSVADPVSLDVLGKLACLSSTPSRTTAMTVLRPGEGTREKGRESRPVSDSSTIGDDWMEQQNVQEILAGGADPSLPTYDPVIVTSAADVLVTPSVPPLCHVSTQTSCSSEDSGSRTDGTLDAKPPSPSKATAAPVNATRTGSLPSEAATSLRHRGADRRPAVRQGSTAPDMNVRECFRQLTKERQFHYTSIRSKLENMVSMLSHRRELVDITNVTLGPGLHRVTKAQKEWGQGLNPVQPMDGVGTWPRARCLH